MNKTVAALDAHQYAIEADVEVVVGQFEIMERMARTCADRCNLLRQIAEPAASAAERMNEQRQQLQNANVQLAHIEGTVARLEAIVREIDGWTTELDVKSRRLAAKHDDA